jgi:ammonium transporter, Amt family
MALDVEVQAALNTLWLLVAAIFCFFLAAGFGLLEVGSARAKNAQSIMLKNLVDSAVAGLSYWAVGFAFAYGPDGNAFIGHGHYFLKGVDDYIVWFFQMVFAGTTGTCICIVDMASICTRERLHVLACTVFLLLLCY